MKYGFGVDVGGTTVKLGLLSEAGELLEKWELPTRTENGGENILPDIARSVQDCMVRRGLSRDDCLGLGIGVPGPATHLQPVQAIVKMVCTDCVCSGAHSAAVGGFAALRMRRALYGR